MELYQEMLGYALAKILAQKSGEIDEKELLGQSSYQALRKIKEILDDSSFTDEACFEKIERIIHVFEELGSGSSRHDFG